MPEDALDNWRTNEQRGFMRKEKVDCGHRLTWLLTQAYSGSQEDRALVRKFEYRPPKAEHCTAEKTAVHLDTLLSYINISTSFGVNPYEVSDTKRYVDQIVRDACSKVSEYRTLKESLERRWQMNVGDFCSSALLQLALRIVFFDNI